MDGVLFFGLLGCGILAAVVYFNQCREYRTLEHYCGTLEYAEDQLKTITNAQVIVNDILTGTKAIPFPGMRKRDTQRHLKIAPGHVYLMCINGEYHKIGYAANVRSRLSGVQMHSPYKVEVLHVITTHHAPRLEVLLQNRYAEKWISGEWFKLDPEDVATVCAIASPITIMDIDRMEALS